MTAQTSATKGASAGGIAVFLGPTLPHAKAARLLDATYHPPIAQGDIVRIVSMDRPRALVIIDGVFAKAPAVRHKEILWAIARGCAVYGASSMGALRAAELAPFGIVGHGLIYRWYRATPFADDDEVAVAMTPAEVGASALSEALINIRLTLRLAERSGIISRPLRIQIAAAAQALHFIQRTYERILADARRHADPTTLAQLAALEAWLPDHMVDQKRADAISLLHQLGAGTMPIQPAIDFSASPFVVTEAFLNDLAMAGIPADRLTM